MVYCCRQQWNERSMATRGDKAGVEGGGVGGIQGNQGDIYFLLGR